MKHFMDTKSHNWREVGLARQISARAVKRARLEFVVLFPALAGVLLVYGYRRKLFGPAFDIPARCLSSPAPPPRRAAPVLPPPWRTAPVAAFLSRGGAPAGDVGRALGPY